MEELHNELMELYDVSPECEHGMYLDAVHGIVVEICKDCDVMNVRPEVADRVENLEALSGETILESYVSYNEIYLKKIKSLPEPEYTLNY
jgi:trehalose-6-phosphatase